MGLVLGWGGRAAIGRAAGEPAVGGGALRVPCPHRLVSLSERLQREELQEAEEEEKQLAEEEEEEQQEEEERVAKFEAVADGDGGERRRQVGACLMFVI